MRRGILKTLLLVLIAGVLLLGLTTTVSANDDGDDCLCDCGSQTWFLDGGSDSPIPGTRLMYKTGSLVTPGPVTVGSGTCAVWCADQAAVGDVTFPYGVWTILVDTDSDWGFFGDDCDIEAGYVNSEGVFTSFANADLLSCYFYGVDKIIEFQVQMGSKTVPQGHYLAVRICNEDSVDHSVIAGGDFCSGSALISPCSDPGYPTPELDTGILLGVGLVGLGGFAYVASKGRKAAV